MERLPPLVRSGLRIARVTYGNWVAHRTIRLGAGLAYYALFAVVPLLVVAVAVAGLVVSESDVQSYLDGRLEELLGSSAGGFSEQISTVLNGSETIGGLGLVGIASLVLAASLLVLSLQDALNTIWEMPVRPGLRTTLLRRLGAVAVILAAGVVVIVGFVINSFTTLIESLAPDVVLVTPLTELFGTAASWVTAVVVIVLLFRYLPDARAPWRSAIVGGSVTTALVAVGTAAIGSYLRNFGASSVAGAAGSVVFVLLWLYYEAQIVLVGAEFTRVLAMDREADGEMNADVNGEASSAA